MAYQSIEAPRLAGWLLKKIIKYNDYDFAIGDLTETYVYMAGEKNRFFAWCWFWMEVSRSMPRFMKCSINLRMTMFKNYFIIALRNFKKHKIYSIINILGLAIGIASCILVYLFIADELSFDKFHDKGNRIYRVVQIRYDDATGTAGYHNPFLPAPMGPEIKRTFSEILHQSRLMSGMGTVGYKDKLFRERIHLVDTPFFEMFTFPLISGNPETVIGGDNTIVLTLSQAEKYFGMENPIGKIMTITYGHMSKDYIVTGVAQNVPSNSSVQFNILIHIANLSLMNNDPDVLHDWNRWYLPFFIQLHEKTTVKQVEQKFPLFCSQYFSEHIRNLKDGGKWTRESMPFCFGLQSIEDIYLDTRVWGTQGLTPSYILSVIGIIILIVACVNYTNMSVGLISVRSMEVGMRKVLGAERKHLIAQFWGEAVLMSLIALISGLMLTGLFLGKFNELSGKQLTLLSLTKGTHLPVVLVITLMAGILAGSYPALVMSDLRPIEILRKKFRIGGKKSITKGLVVVQFALTVVLLLTAVMMGRQTAFLMNMDLGYKKEGLIVIMTQENEKHASESLFYRFRNKAVSHSKIMGISASNREYGQFLPGSSLDLEDRKINYRFNRVDPEFISTLGLTLIQGRDFFENPGVDGNAIIVNERFLQELGPGHGVGNTLGDPSKGFPSGCRIIGIIQDSHFQSLRTEIAPLLLFVGEGMSARRNVFSRIFVRIQTGHLKETLDFVERTWKEIQPTKPIITYFHDEVMKRQYNQERWWNNIVRYSSVLSIIIACMGVFGLTAIILNRRVKEIGIRRILGAEVSQIIRLVVGEFVFLVVLANIIGWPVAYFIIRYVLQNYPYRIGIGLLHFILTGVATIIIAVLTILYLSLRAALANPVESLKYE